MSCLPLEIEIDRGNKEPGIVIPSLQDILAKGRPAAKPGNIERSTFNVECGIVRLFTWTFDLPVQKYWNIHGAPNLSQTAKSSPSIIDDFLFWRMIRPIPK